MGLMAGALSQPPTQATMLDAVEGQILIQTGGVMVAIGRWSGPPADWFLISTADADGNGGSRDFDP